MSLTPWSSAGFRTRDTRVLHVGVHASPLFQNLNESIAFFPCCLEYWCSETSPNSSQWGSQHTSDLHSISPEDSKDFGQFGGGGKPGDSTDTLRCPSEQAKVLSLLTGG